MWKLCGYEWNPGEKLQLRLDTGVQGYTLPATFVCGVRPGRTLLITAGIHSDEYPGIAAAIRIAEELDPSLLAGNVLILPCVNVGGFWARSVAKIPEDGFNLNADYPGKPDGTPGERLADFFVRQIFPEVDFILDLHSGSVMEALTPCLFFPCWDTPVRQRRDESGETSCERRDENRKTSCERRDENRETSCERRSESREMSCGKGDGNRKTSCERRGESREASCEEGDGSREAARKAGAESRGTACEEEYGSRETVREASLAAAKALSIPYLVESHASGGEYSYAARYLGIPGLLLERGHSGMYEREWADAYVRDIRLLLAHLGMTEPGSTHSGMTEPGRKRALDCVSGQKDSGLAANRAANQPEAGFAAGCAANRPDSGLAVVGCAGKETGGEDLPEQKYICTKAVYLEASEPGIWYPRVRENDRIRKGQLLGHTEDFFGNRIREYYAEDDGIVFYYCCSLSVTEGRLLAAYGTEFE